MTSPSGESFPFGIMTSVDRKSALSANHPTEANSITNYYYVHSRWDLVRPEGAFRWVQAQAAKGLCSKVYAPRPSLRRSFLIPVGVLAAAPRFRGNNRPS